IEEFGSLENATNLVLQDDPQLLQQIQEERKGWAQERSDCEALVVSLIRRLATKLADVPTWKALAERDPAALRSEVNLFLRACKSALNAVCGIESHRSADTARNAVVVEIKLARPDLSFGQVAREYTRRTGQPMDAKNAERIFARRSVPFAREPLLAAL